MTLGREGEVDHVFTNRFEDKFACRDCCRFFYNVVVIPNLKRISEFIEPLGISKYSSSLFGLAYGRSCFRFVELSQFYTYEFCPVSFTCYEILRVHSPFWSVGNILKNNRPTHQTSTLYVLRFAQALSLFSPKSNKTQRFSVSRVLL